MDGTTSALMGSRASKMKDASQFLRGMPPATIAADSMAAAETARLRYVVDWQPGISRRKDGKGFAYFGSDGKPVRDGDELRRIKALAIPPAWNDVWICRWANGHLQATGRDARGRKQYRYHARWREVRDENKYARMIGFAQALPRIRAQVEHDIGLPGLPRAKILATVVKLLESTFIRVGNEEYANNNKSFGLATLHNRHVKVTGPKIRFQFRGKSRVEHAISLEDRRLARIIKRCQDLPGYALFQYVDEEGTQVAIEAADVNAYLRDIAGSEFSTKDFRTWAGTVLAARALVRFTMPSSSAQTKRNIVKAIEGVAQALRNTKAVCRKCYIHPALINAYTDGSLLRFLSRGIDHAKRKKQKAPGNGSRADREPAARRERSDCGLSQGEAALLRFLQQQQNSTSRERPWWARRRQASLGDRLRRSIKAVSRRGSSQRQRIMSKSKFQNSRSRA
jgi:DNA topoisomerase-1